MDDKNVTKERDVVPTSRERATERQQTMQRDTLAGSSPRHRPLSGSSSNADSPCTEAKSPFTFGTKECLPGSKNGKAIGGERPGLLRLNSSISQFGATFSKDADSNCSSVAPSIRSPPIFGRSRRMSRSLPELRDLQFVSVLPDLEEEESEITEYEGDEVAYEKPTRLPWHRKLDFVLCSICHSLGLGNFWRFPYYCYSNGGGAFMFAYLILLVICGVPLLCMEYAIGQLTQSGPISAFGQLCPLMKGIGVASMVLTFWVTAYYSVLVSWTLFYAFNSFYSPPRWTRCTNSWNSKLCREERMYDDEDDDTTASGDDDSNAKTTLPMSFAEALRATTVSPGLSGAFNHSTVGPSWSADTVVTFRSAYNISNIEYVDTDKNFTHPAVEFVRQKMLGTSDGIGSTGELRFELLAAVLFVWVLIYIALRKTDFFRGTTIYVLTVVSHLLLFSIFLRTVALEGAKDGLHFLFQPEWSKLANARLWLYALSQAFHSLGVVLGPSILMGSCHKPHNNLLRDSIVLAVVTILTVLLIGCVTFGTIGHLALKLNKPMDKVLDDDPSTVFVMYSVVISSMPVPSCWGVVFFLVFLCLGLDSQIRLMATLVSALKEAYTYYIKQRFQGHSLFLAAICGVCFLAGIPYVTQAGLYFLQLVDHYIAVMALCVVALLETCTLGWLYGASNLTTAVQQMTGKTPSCFYKLSWRILSPCSILVVLIYCAITMRGSVVHAGYTYPTWAHITGWVVFGLTLCWIPILAIAAYRKAPKTHLFSRLGFTIQPKIRSSSDAAWEPKPMIIFNGSTVNDMEFPDYKMPELPSSANSVQSYVIDRHSGLDHQNDETNL